MNVPKPLWFEVDAKTILKILKVFIRTIQTDCLRVYRILRHVLCHSTAKSEKETSQLAVGLYCCCEVEWSCPPSSALNIAAIFTQHFVTYCPQLVILRHDHTDNYFVNKDTGI